MKIFKTAVLLWLSFLSIAQVSAASIEKIDFVDTQTLQLSLTGGVELPLENIEGEFKVLRDIQVTFSSKDFNNNKKIIVTLGDEIKPNTAYSLLAVYGVDGGIDFMTPEVIDGYQMEGEVGLDEQWITSLYIADSRTLELTFAQDIPEDEFEFKIFNEVNIDSLSGVDTTQLQIHTQNELTALSEYILMVISLKDILGMDIELDEDLKELSAPEHIPTALENMYAQEDMPEEDIIQEDMQDEEMIPNVSAENQDQINEEENFDTPQLNAAGEDEGNLEDIALGVEETPDTGASTNVLIALTLLVNAALFFRKKFAK